MNKNFLLFDYLDSHGRNVMQDWADSLPMQKRDRGRLDAKIDMLETAGDNLPPKLLQNTSGKYKQRHIMELALNGKVALRPLLCRGPFAVRSEFTLLFGAVERDRKYVPIDAPKRAEENRLDLLTHTGKRCHHEPFSK